MVTSILRYPGGKNKALSFLLERMPEGIKDWREPFFGGGSVTIGFLQSQKSKDCKRFVVGDLYPELYSLWKATQQNPNKVKELVYEYMNNWCPTHEKLMSEPGFIYRVGEKTEYTPMVEQAVEEARKFWEWASNVDCEAMTLEERAARFLIINRTSFSGMGDSGSLTEYQLMNFKSSDVERLDELSRLLQPVEILNASFEVTMANPNKESTFVFLDPPYYQQSKTPMYGRKGNMHKGFPHEALAELLKNTDCKWLMTYDDSMSVRRLYGFEGAYITPFKLTYTMSGNNAEDALAGEEVLISNYYSGEEDTMSDEDLEAWL